MGKYKHGKPNEEINLETFKRKLERSKLRLRYKAYAVLLYWIGCRRSEPLQILKEHVTEKDGALFIEIPALKGGERGGPVELSSSLYGVDFVEKVWKKTRKKRKLFPFCSMTGYRVIKSLFPKKTPHWLRHNRVTKLRRKIDGDLLTLDDVKSFTGIKSDSTIQHYGMKTTKGIHRVSKALD